MTETNLGGFLRRLGRGMAAQTLRDRPDRQLAEMFLAGRDEAAFDALVRRHGPMVYRVCWRVLRHAQDVEDAFQATFLLLAQNLRTVRRHDALASWLHGVAYRVALKAKARAATRRRHERQAPAPPAVAPEQATWGELRTALDAELARLPEKWRLPLILCYLEGRTQDEAARQLGWGKNTLRRRLEEARGVLGRRLSRRGLMPAAALGALLLSECTASAVAPASVAASTSGPWALIAARRGATPPAVPVRVAALTNGVLKTMWLTKLKAVVIVLLGVALLGGGSVLVRGIGPLAGGGAEGAVPGQSPGQAERKERAARRPMTPEEQLQAILKDYQAARQEFKKALDSAQTDEERGRIVQTKYPDGPAYAKRLLALARANPDDPVAADALVWICTNVPQTTGGLDPKTRGKAVPEAGEALDLLYKNHLRSDKLVPVCHMARSAQNLRNPLTEKLLREVVRRNPHPPVVAQACLSLAYLARDRARTAEELKRLGKDSELFRRVRQLDTEDEVKLLLSCDPAAQRRQAEEVLRRLAKDFGDVPVYGEKVTFGEKAKSLLADLRELVVGKAAPEIKGEDLDGVRFKLSDNRGKVVVLVFWGTWCAACMAQVPQERALVEKYKDKPFVLLGVNADDDREKLPEALRKHGITWRSWRDGREGPIAGRWGVTSWPTVYVLDAKGTIRYKNVRNKELDEAVERLLRDAEVKKKP